MKKMVSLLLCLSMVMALSVPAFAASEPVPHDEVIRLQEIGHGEYALAENLFDDPEAPGDYITATATKDSEIYHYKDNQYFVQNGSGNYMLNDRIDVNIEDFDANQAAFEKYHITDADQKEMKAVIDEQKVIGNDELKIEIYAPRAAGETTTNHYTYTYNGTQYRLQDTVVAYRDIHVGPLEKRGSNVLGLAKEFGDITIDISGVTNVVISLFGYAQTAYDVYVATYGEVVTGSSDDKMWVTLKYDRLHKTTSVYSNTLNTYRAGCVSHKVWIEWANLYEYYRSVGEEFQKPYTVNRQLFSPNFERPEIKAIQFAGDYTFIDGYMETKLLGHRLIFSGT